MQTTRVVLKVPFHQHPAGTVFELPAETDIAGWHPDERAREKLAYGGGKPAYLLPDNGRGRGVELHVSDTAPCPEHLFDGSNLNAGPSRVTRVFTARGETDEETAIHPPCGRLTEQHITLETNEALKSQAFRIDLPPFDSVVEKMVLYDTMRRRVVLEYELRNYKPSDTRLSWDVSDLYPGFFDLRVQFPGGWAHTIRFIKSFPFPVDLNNIPPAPEKRADAMARKIFQKMEAEERAAAEKDLRNQALDLCLEWGEHFNKPTQERMMSRFGISPAEADELDRLAREVRSFVYGLCEQELAGDIQVADIHFQTLRKYPWVNAQNFARMKNVGMYYARR